MMELELNGKIYKFVFGFKFLKEINKRHNFSQNGVSVSLGVANVAVGLQSGDVESLADTLLIANATETPRLLEKDLPILFEEYDPEQLFEDVLKALEESVFTRAALKKAMVQTEE